jgi:hypothetical protein
MNDEFESLPQKIARNIALFFPAEAKAIINNDISLEMLGSISTANWICTSIVPVISGDATPDEKSDLSETILRMISEKDADGIRRIADFIDRVKAGTDKVEHFAPALHFVSLFSQIQGRLPTKSELKGILLQSKAKCPSEDDKKGWARLFETAGLKAKLPKKKPHRGASRNGTLKKKRKPPTK